MQPQASNWRYRYHPDRTLPAASEIFVFGSNTAGRHGKGAAKVAVEKFGAVYGQAEGIQGDAYGLPTKLALPSGQLVPLPLPSIAAGVGRLLRAVLATPDRTFFVTRVGCELAGFSDEQIAPLFRRFPRNCSFAEQWRRYLE